MTVSRALSKIMRVFTQRFMSAPAAPAKPARPKTYYKMAPEKRMELEKLCEQLLKKKALITSGKLQFIGLEKIRKRFGKQWSGMASIVYEITEDVMRQYLGKDDFYFRYKDDSYILLMSKADMLEGRIRAGAIAEAIRERLFALDERDLKDLEVREAVRQLKANFASYDNVTDFLDEFTQKFDEDEDGAETDASAPQDNEKNNDVSISPIEVETSDMTVRPISVRNYNFAELSHCYLPLWDVPRNALTTYLCLLKERDEPDADVSLTGHMAFYRGHGPGRILDIDLFNLKTVITELQAMEAAGRKLLIACPVSYDTLYHFESYEQYKHLMMRIPEEHKGFLIFYVTGTPQALPAKDPFWFSFPMQQFARQMIVEFSLQHEIDFNKLRSAGIKSISVNIEADSDNEQQLLKKINNFVTRAMGYHIKTMAIMGVSTLSVTTSAVCAGFKLLGGRAIHDMVQTPDNVHRYRHEDLLKGLAPPEAAQ